MFVFVYLSILEGIMFFTERKLKQRVEELLRFELHDIQTIQSFDFCYDRKGVNGAPPPNENADWQNIEQGFEWKEKDIYVWLRLSHTFPKTDPNRSTHIGLFNFSLSFLRDEYEALLYVNGKPWHGLDKNHNVISFPDDFSGKTIRFDIRIWSGVLEGKVRQHFDEFHVGNSIKQVAFGLRDKATHDLYVTSTAILQTLDVISTNDFYYSRLLNLLDSSFLLINWQNPSSKEFYQSISNASSYLEENYSKDAVKSPVVINSVGHTHIDLAFLWQIKHTREKCARSFSTVLKLMKQFPKYNFFQSQPQLYEYVKNDYPEIYDQIKQRVKDGRWQVDGAMWVEADCNIPSGESFVRQIMYGKNFMETEFGITPECLWLPDVFGYSWALPQILKKSGIKYFMTTKISWNEFNQLPHDTFKWRGIDGSDILAHFVTTPEEGHPRYTYNGIVNAKSVQGLWDNYKDKGLTKTLLLPFGYGDGGGGPNEQMLELLERFEKMPVLPNIQFGTVKQFFHELEDNINHSNDWFHTWDGELYFETHRGTYTSQAQIKKANRLAELDIRFIEWLSVTNSILNNDWSSYEKNKLDYCWKLILRNQFHDIIPGSSIHEVYQDAKLEFQDLNNRHNEILSPLLQNITDSDVNSKLILNSSNFERKNDVVYFATCAENLTIKDESNQHFTIQKSKQNDGYFVEIPSIAPLSCINVSYENNATSENGKVKDAFIYNDNEIDTPFYLIKWNEFGHLTRIFDKKNNREVLSGCGNVLTVYEDKPMKYDAWDIEIFHIQKKSPVVQLQSVELTELGPLICEITFKWIFNNSSICQKMRVYSNNPKIDFITDIDWHDCNQLLKTVFPVDIRAVEATYDIQFGNVKRSTTWNTSWDYAKFESVAHQWADLSEYGYGVSLLNNCKYGHAIRDNIMQLTLIKSAISPDLQADQGQHQFTYSLFPHTKNWQEGNVAQEAWFLNEPLRIYDGKLKSFIKPSNLSILTLDNHLVQVDALKKAESGDWLILRIHDFSGGTQNVNISSHYNINWWRECDLMENFIDQNINKGNLKIKLSPFEIKTYAISIN